VFSLVAAHNILITRVLFKGLRVISEDVTEKYTMRNFTVLLFNKFDCSGQKKDDGVRGIRNSNADMRTGDILMV
jgi:hypothetical protein